MKRAVRFIVSAIIPVGLTVLCIIICVVGDATKWWYFLISSLLGLAGFHFVIVRPSPYDVMNTPPMYREPYIRFALYLSAVCFLVITVIEFIFLSPWWLTLLVFIGTAVLSLFLGNFAAIIICFVPLLIFREDR